MIQINQIVQKSFFFSKFQRFGISEIQNFKLRISEIQNSIFDAKWPWIHNLSSNFLNKNTFFTSACWVQNGTTVSRSPICHYYPIHYKIEAPSQNDFIWILHCAEKVWEGLDIAYLLGYWQYKSTYLNFGTL